MGVRKLIPNWIVNTFWHWPIGLLAAVVYGFPARKLTLIGVTGTDGKTTTVYLINHILKTAGRKTMMISSVAAEICGKQNSTGLHITSPHPFYVQKYLRRAAEKRAEYAVLEVTSHAMDQHRFAGCKFKLAVLTNIRPDHLDYHKSFNKYAKAKFRLLDRAEIIILNKDDKSYKAIMSRKHGTIAPRFRDYSIKDGKQGLMGIIKKEEIQQPENLPGDYNLSNIMASAAAALELGINKETILKAIKTFAGVPGRFEEIETKKGFRVIIDFAHTPYALEKVLMTLKSQLKKESKLISVFGCAADRGAERRKMGKVSAKLANLTVITAEDPRFEGVEKISEEIAGWAVKGGGVEKSICDRKKQKHYYVKIPDRQEAIDFAIKTAKKGDIVVLCGKGHEKSMNFKGIEYPWDEKKAALKALIEADKR